MQLFIGNNNYSSWSIRPWVLLRQFDIPFDEVIKRSYPLPVVALSGLKPNVV